MKIDIVFLLVQSSAVILVGLAPILIALLVKPSARSMFAFAGGCVLSFALLGTVIYVQNVDKIAWHLGNHFGPSVCSIRRELIPALIRGGWLPPVIAGGVIVSLKRLYPQDVSWKKSALIVFMATSLAGAWVIFLAWAGALTQECTLWADGFSHAKWRLVEVGMPRDAVYELIGNPLKHDDETTKASMGSGFTEGGITPELWAVRSHAGWNAAIWFTNDMVKEKRLWFMD